MRLLHVVLAGCIGFTAGCSDMSAFPPQRWKYERVHDKLRDVTDVTAELKSNERFRGGGVEFRRMLTVERKHGQPDVGWFPGSGIFCDPSNPTLMRLDKGPVEVVPCRLYPQSNGYVSRLDEHAIRRIERASTMVVEFSDPVERSRATFNVKGLRLN